MRSGDATQSNGAVVQKSSIRKLPCTNISAEDALVSLPLMLALVDLLGGKKGIMHDLTVKLVRVGLRCDLNHLKVSTLKRGRVLPKLVHLERSQLLDRSSQLLSASNCNV